MNFFRRLISSLPDCESDDDLVPRARRVLQETKYENNRLQGKLDVGPTGFRLGDAVVNRRKPKNGSQHEHNHDRRN